MEGEKWENFNVIELELVEFFNKFFNNVFDVIKVFSLILIKKEEVDSLLFSLLSLVV